MNGEPAAAVACARCSIVGEPQAALLWTCSREQGTTRYYCPACSREHARDIEAGLPAEYW